VLIVKKENKFSLFILIQGGNLHTIKENAEALLDSTRKIGLDVSADKTKYMFMNRVQNAG